MNTETSRFHDLVQHGSLADLKLALEGGAAVNAPGHIGKTALMVAMGAKDLDKLKLLIEFGADLELTHDFNATALRQAVSWNFAEGVAFLLSLGAERGHQPKYSLKQIEHDLTHFDIPMSEGLAQVMSEAEWNESVAKTRESMRELGRKPTVTPMIADVQSLAVLKLFLAAGDDLQLAPNDMRRAYVGLATSGEFRSTPQDYKQQKSPRFGTRNPQPMDFAFWRDMIATGGNAYTARQHFADTDPFAKPGPVWCFDRFGSTLTQLPDGRFVQIGGEHEDHYDPDFYIYNDVVIHDGQGNFQIFGYPKNVFPPTDFHSATLVGDAIYIIGCLGYPDQRSEQATPVYRLKLNTWQIEPVSTQGELPGWNFGHRARYDPLTNSIHITAGERHVMQHGKQQIVPNEEKFELDLATFRWRKVN